MTTNPTFIKPSLFWEVVMHFVLPILAAATLVLGIYFQVFQYHPENFNNYVTETSAENP